FEVNFGGFKTGLFPAAVVEVAEVIDAEDFVAGGAEGLRGVGADESGGAGDENRAIGHRVSLAGEREKSEFRIQNSEFRSGEYAGPSPRPSPLSTGARG